jgi:hypothetical protein
MDPNTKFGSLLRIYRGRSRHPISGKSLTQEQLGELIGNTVGTTAYSGTAVSDWERNRSHIHKDDRTVLLALVATLYQYGGITTIEEANTMLLAGNYRSLDQEETNILFQIKPSKTEHKQLFARGPILLELLKQTLMPNLPPPTRQNWSASLLSIMGWMGDKMNPWSAIRGFFWLLGWIFAVQTLTPVLRLFSKSELQIGAIGLYALGAFSLPWLVGGLIQTREDVFWRDQGLAKDWQVRAYTYLGAATGLHVGFTLLFMLGLVYYYASGEGLGAWASAILLILALVISAASAREVPFNQWRAFARVRLRDGAIFSVFIVFPFLFSFFWIVSYDVLLNRLIGPLVFSLAFLIIAWLSVHSSRNKCF